MATAYTLVVLNRQGASEETRGLKTAAAIRAQIRRWDKPREMTARVWDSDGALVYEGPAHKYKPRGPGRPVSTGSDGTEPIRFRVSAVQRAELAAEARRLGLATGDSDGAGLAAKRRAFPATAT